MKNYLYLTVLFVIFFTSTSNAYAVGIDLDKLTPLQDVAVIEQTEFEKQTTAVESTPYNDEFLAYQVRLPEGWKQSENDAKTNQFTGTLSQRVLGIVSKYVSPAKNLKRNSFSVEALELSHEISARNWFIDYIVKKGLTLEQVDEGDGDEVEAVYVEVTGDETFLVRVRAIKNGPRMILARYSVPLADYKEEALMQSSVLQSFELINKEDYRIEEFKSYGFLDQSYFDYPVSWSLNAPYIRSINRMKAGLYYSADGGKNSGQIRIFLTNKDVDTTRSGELKKYRQQVSLDGYQLGKFIEQLSLPMHPEISYSTTQVYEYLPISNRFMDHEMWFTYLEGADYFYYVFLLTPSRQANFYSWARNVETHKEVLKTLRRTSRQNGTL